MSEQADRSGVPQLFLASRVAQMHYVEDLTNLQIAARLGISRFRVARLLERARASGVVEITIHSPLAVDQDLSRELVARFGLAEALVAPAPETGDPDGASVTAGVGRLAARYLADVLSDGATFGVTWGAALESVARALGSLGAFPRCDVVQLVGGLSAATSSRAAMDVLATFAQVAGGSFAALDAPLAVLDPQTADALRAETSIASVLARVGSLDAAVVGIGSWDPPSSQLVPLFAEADVARAVAAGARGDIAAIILDAEGRELGGELAARTIRADAAAFRTIPYVIGVAVGATKAAGVRAALAGRWANVLVVDAGLARALLAPG